MNKKAFTLVELLAVIVIIGIVAVIIFPNINNIILSSRKSLYADQIKDIEKAAQKWATDDPERLGKYNLNNVYIPLKILQQDNFLEKDNIKNPMTREEMNGCIEIKYNIEEDKREYIYIEKSCNEAVKDQDDTLGYIIYEYDAAGAGNIDKSHMAKSAGEYIYSIYKDNIHVDGETVAGLYDVGDEYVFRGSDVNNYVEINYKDKEGSEKNNIFRILSIDKKDYSLRLMSDGVATIWDENNNIDYPQSNLNKILSESDKKYGINKIVESNFYTGTLNNEPASLESIKSILNKGSSMKYGTLSVIDYINASATYECSSNFLSSKCGENNYIANQIGEDSTMWTFNTSSNGVWYVGEDRTISSTMSSSDLKKVFTVIKLSPSVHIIDEDTTTGAEHFEYKLK